MTGGRQMSGTANTNNGFLGVCEKISFGKGASAFSFDFLGRANIWVDNTYDSDVFALCQYLIMEAISRTYPGQLQIIGYDSDLTGIFAPFAQLSSGEGKSLSYLSSPKELKDYLSFLRLHIQSVHNVIQGRTSNLIEFREAVNHPIEGYKLVVLATDIGVLDPAIKASLPTLLKVGPAVGISFLIISTTVEVHESLLKHNTVLSVSSNNITNESNDKITAKYTPYPALEIIKKCSEHQKKAEIAASPIIRFSDVNGNDVSWGESSKDGISFIVGRYGFDNVRITLGDDINQRHNVLITGAVGQGKSNVLSVIIHSLCQRYSPKELNLYMLDYKEGVTLKAFSNIGQEAYLPHAKALGLESDVVFGLSILAFLFDEYKRRFDLFKNCNVRSISEYRESNPDEEMPRIVVIIDEFQLMFGDDDTNSRKVADYLEKSVRLFRAAGIHFILASQSIGGNAALVAKTSTLFSQVPIRIAHKNSVLESHLTLGLDNSAAAHIRSREAIINLDYGEISQNKKTAIAYADENYLAKLRYKWWSDAKGYAPPPYVFDSTRRITISESIGTISMLRDAAAVPKAFIGTEISVSDTPVAIPMPNESGRNIAILGASADEKYNTAIGIMQSVAISLAAQDAKGVANFVICDFLGDEELNANSQPLFTELMKGLGYFVETVNKKNFYEYITQKTESLPTHDEREKTYIFALGLDKWEYVKEPYADPPLKKFLTNASNKGIHFFGWWVKTTSYASQAAGHDGTGLFNTKIFLRIDERSVQPLTNPFVKWTPKLNRALIFDDVEFSDAKMIVPYSPIKASDVSSYISKFS
jgi:hypothetical protein